MEKKALKKLTKDELIAMALKYHELYTDTYKDRDKLKKTLGAVEADRNGLSHHTDCLQDKIDHAKCIVKTAAAVRCPEAGIHTGMDTRTQVEIDMASDEAKFLAFLYDTLVL